jgi:hypothetical protein
MNPCLQSWQVNSYVKTTLPLRFTGLTSDAASGLLSDSVSLGAARFILILILVLVPTLCYLSFDFEATISVIFES